MQLLHSFWFRSTNFGVVPLFAFLLISSKIFSIFFIKSLLLLSIPFSDKYDDVPNQMYDIKRLKDRNIKTITIIVLN